ncbi:hypothetical protein MMC30_005736 [Trapelia coarctata]|nr:hypothetical protein [Trapelia coarctata]
MPSRSNPNTPTTLKRKSAAQLKSKRKQTQRKVIRSKITKSGANTTKLGTSTTLTGTAGMIKGVGRVKGTSQEIRKENARRRRVAQAEKREKAAMKKGKRVRDGEEMDVEVEERGEDVGMDVD